MLVPLLNSRTTLEWIGLLEQANVPCGPINRIDQVFSDPQAIARKLTVPMARDGQALDLVASPLRLERTPPEYRLPPPHLGEHTEEILRQTLQLEDREKLSSYAAPARLSENTLTTSAPPQVSDTASPLTAARGRSSLHDQLIPHLCA